MSFDKAVETGSTGSAISSDDWSKYNELEWNLLDVNPVKDAKGKETKTATLIGVLNFVAELGTQPQAPFSMVSTTAPPQNGEDMSVAEIERLKKFKSNWFEWVDEWDKNEKAMKTVRKVFWNQDPVESLVLAVDFPALQFDYSKHPASESEESDLRPFRIDYNGKFQRKFERTVVNEVNYKTKKFGDKDIKYKIISATGQLEQYQKDGHNLKYLIQATCNWDVVMTKNVKDGKTYYKTQIKNPTALQDIKERNGNYTVAEQLADLPEVPKFCGLLLNGGDYSEENLKQVRGMWWDEMKKSTQFDKNVSLGRPENGEWLMGRNWMDSDIAKAYYAAGLGNKEEDLGKTDPLPEPKPEDKPAAPQQSAPQDSGSASAPSEPTVDFDGIPF